MIISASEENFIKCFGYGNARADLIPILRAARYYVLDDVIIDMLTDQNSSEECKIYLQGLVDNSVIKGRAESDFMCSPVDNLINLPQWVLPMAIESNGTLVSLNDPHQDDINILRRNAIDVYSGECCISEWIYNKIVGNRIIDTWNLVDNGRIFPRDIFGRRILTASLIKIYDHYYNSRTLNMLRDIFTWTNGNRGQVDISIKLYTLCHGEEVSRSTIEREIRSSLGAYIVNRSKIHVYDIITPSMQFRLHDRYIQIDRNSTFIVTAGCDAFYDDTGVIKNRACSIFLSTIVDDNRIELKFKARRPCGIAATQENIFI